MSRLWLLNLDAERELDNPANYQTPASLLEQMRRKQGQLRWLVEREAVWDGRGQVLPGSQALCWCPTPSALAKWHRAGTTLAAPTLSALQQANHRHQLLRFDEAGLERRFVTSDTDLDWLETGGSFRLKRAFGFAGKGQRVVRGMPSNDDLRWIRDSARRGFLRERDVAVVEEWSIHGYVDEAGALWGRPCSFVADARGRVSSVRRCELDVGSTRSLLEAAQGVCDALVDVGYWGPFGIDAFSFADGSRVRFNPVSDINARFTLGWSIGMGAKRACALERLVARST